MDENGHRAHDVRICNRTDWNLASSPRGGAKRTGASPRRNGLDRGGVRRARGVCECGGDDQVQVDQARHPGWPADSRRSLSVLVRHHRHYPWRGHGSVSAPPTGLTRAISPNIFRSSLRSNGRSVQPECVADDRHRAERHCRRGDHRRKQKAEVRIEDAGGDRDSDGVVDERVDFASQNLASAQQLRRRQGPSPSKLSSLAVR